MSTTDAPKFLHKATCSIMVHSQKCYQTIKKYTTELLSPAVGNQGQNNLKIVTAAAKDVSSEQCCSLL